ncbi:MAG TPA: glycine cleavage system aminomethyltransferase GcvT [Candidatus Polarisedimenticolia bacterium]|nr:glycine cleavage system aminomethyltransferase GcvT [Candidatus Polarisedimenticolia bacterium]
MTTTPGDALKRTPLNALFHEMGARMVDFAGWEMPVQFSSVIEEHVAVRTAAGLFDVSHMGEIAVEGKDALALVQRVTCNDASTLTPGRAQYSALLNERGGVVDDILVYRLAAERFLLVVNAGNTDKDFAWIKSKAAGEARIENTSAAWAQLALQGPASASIMGALGVTGLESMRYYHFALLEVGGAESIVSRTGYTGEDGFEIYCPPAAAADIFRRLVKAGGSAGLKPCGLGARDTLRLEARMPLYGNDLDDTTTPIEAGLEWIVKTAKGEFIGRAALEAQQSGGLKRRLAGFEMVDRGIGRHGYPVRSGGREVGVVTSGTFGPYLKKNIGLAYVPPALSEPGARFDIVIRDRDTAAVVVPTPFYKRTRPAGGSAGRIG